jgi:hypothetical protein
MYHYPLGAPLSLVSLAVSPNVLPKLIKGAFVVLGTVKGSSIFKFAAI